MPAVTVVLATYNWAEVLPYSIASVLEQTYRDLELRVVGDGCTDHSEEVVAAVRDPRVSWHNLAANTGHQSGPNNEAIRQSDSRLIAYIGHDDLWLPHHLARLVAALDDGAGVAHASALIVSPGRPPYAYPRGLWRYRADNWLPPSVVSHERSLVSNAGPWRPPSQTGQLESESDMWHRLSTAAGRPPRWVREVSAMKLPAASRPNVYRERPHHEQAEWLARIRAGEEWPSLVPFRPRNLVSELGYGVWYRWGRPWWRRPLGRATPEKAMTAEERWRSRARTKGL